MHARRLGRTGYQVSEVGFGAWGIGRSEWMGADDEDSKRALGCALDEGVTLFDTAYAYGNGHSEQLIAEVLAERGVADQVVVTTKIPPKNLIWPGFAATPVRQVFPPRYVTEMVEASLRNLRAEAIQVEQLHVWNDAWLEAPEWGETRAAMERLKEEGKVLHWGVSINDHAPETALGIASDPLIDAVQVIYNIFDRKPEAGLFPLAAARGFGVIVRCPFDEGALTGKIGPETEFPRGDFRNDYFADDRRAEVARRVTALEPLLGDEAAGMPELALRFCLAPPEVSVVIPGMRRERHVRSNAAVSDGRDLSGDLLARLQGHAWDKNFYEGL